jgi:two-component system OmpR family sensor kinase
MSLRARLLAGMAFVALVLVVVSVLVTRTTRSELLGQIDDRLRGLSSADGDKDGDGRFPFPDEGYGQAACPAPPPGGFRDRYSDLFEGCVDGTGTVTAIFTPNLPGEEDIGVPEISIDDIPERGTVLFTTGATASGSTYRVEIKRFENSDSEIVAWVWAIPIDDVEDTIGSLMLVEILGSVAILAALGLVGWWVVHLGIRPVKEMTQTATQIAAGDLTVRVPEGSPGTESGQLAVALNQMLGHIEGALEERAQSEQRLRRFVADASHELRTPITTIRGYAELYRIGGLRQQTALDDAMRRTEQEATRMGRLVEDMLVLAKFDEQRPLDLRHVDLVRLARDAAADARARAQERTITFDTEVDDAIVNGDEDRLRQVIGNVVSNAIVHTESSVPISISIRRLNGDIVLEVADEGPGMPAEVAARVTERFFRADPARARNRGGSGLGLSIVDAAVSAHGGSVEIDSVEGHGTTVRLVLPAAV